MKKILATILVLALCSLQAWAVEAVDDHDTTVEVKEKIKAENSGTIISVQKGTIPINSDFSITEGSDEVEGEPSPLQTTARQNWKKECDDWKKELKELNKDNQVLALSCGSAKCAATGTAQTICKSQATYKLKVKMK